MTADFGSVEKIDVYSLRSEGDLKVICNPNPTGNGIACADAIDGKERGESGSPPPVVSNGNAVDSSEKENGDDGLRSVPEADPAGDVGDVRRTDEIAAGEKEEHLVDVDSAPSASEDGETSVKKESNTEPISENGDDRLLDVVSLNSESETAENQRDLEIDVEGKVASNCSAYYTKVSANDVELMSPERTPAVEKNQIPLAVNHQEANNLDIMVDKENAPILVDSDTQIAVCPEASVVHVHTPEMELTVSMRDVGAASEKASVPVASLAGIAIPIAVADLDMMANETFAAVSDMLEADIAVGSEEVQIPEIGDYEEAISNCMRGELTDTRHEDEAEESNQLPRDNGLHQEQEFAYAEPDLETSGTSNGMANPEIVEVEQEDACGDTKVEMCSTFTENKIKAEELHRENGESNQLNLTGSKENRSLLQEREDVCAEDMRSNTNLSDSQFQTDRVIMGATEDKTEAELDADEQPRGDQVNKTTVTPKDLESADEVQEISATMDIGYKAITSSTVVEIDNHENKSSNMEVDQREGLKSEAEEDERQVLDAAAVDIDQHLELESSMIKEKQDIDSDLKHICDVESRISITELDREIYSKPLTVIEDITSVMDDQVSLSSNVVDDKGKQDCGSFSMEADQQAELALVAQKDDRQGSESAASDSVQNLEIESSELNVKEKVDIDSVSAIQPINNQGSEILSNELDHERKLPSNDKATDAPTMTRTNDQVNPSFVVDGDRQESESAGLEVQHQGELESVSEATGSLELETSGADIGQSLQIESGSSEEKQNTESACNETDCDTEMGEKLAAPLEPESSDWQHPQEPSLEPSEENGIEQPDSLDHLEEEQENRNMILEIKEQESPSHIKEVQQEHLVTKHVRGERAEMLPLRQSGEGKKHILRFADVVPSVNVSGNWHDECESTVRLQSASEKKYCSAVIINNAAVQSASFVDNILIQFGTITQDQLLGRSNEPIVSEKEKFYIVKVPNFAYDLYNDVRKAQNDLTERTKIRDSINSEIQEHRAICTICRENLRSSTEKLRTARESLQTAQNKLLLVQNANSLKEIDDKIKKLEFRLHSESMTLKEEKQHIDELKLLGKQRERLCSSMGPEKKDLSNELGLTKELDSLKDDFAQAEEEVKAARMKYEDEERFLKVLKAKQNDANSTRQKAYEDFCNLRTKLREKSAPYRKFKGDQEIAYDYASSRNIESLRLHCSQQVDRLMNIWNNDDGFRKKYIESIKKSTSRGFRTLDEAPSFLDEEQTLISKVSKDVSLSSNEVSPPAIPRSSDTLSEPGKKRNPLPALQPVQSSKLAKQRKPSKTLAESKGTIITVSSGSDNVKDTGEISSQIKEEEEIALKVEELTIEEEKLKKEKAAMELKEKLRLEQRIKAKEAEERKKKQVERAKAKAEYRAQKEAELKDKMKAKKENKKVIASVDTSQSGAELVAAPTTNNDLPENSQDLEAPVATCSKRPSKQVSSIKQYNRIQPVPLPLRNKGRRRTSTWTWMILTILAVGILFLLGNYIPFPSFNFP